MGATKMNDIYDPYDPSLWVFDDRYPYSLSDLKDFPFSKEMEEKLDALADEIFGPRDEVQPMA